VARMLSWFGHWRPASIVEFVLSGEGAEDVGGFETTGPRGDDPGGNVLVGYLAADAGRPELARPALERAADHYRNVLELTDSRDEELAALVERLEADAGAV
jgi:hypothetical protein